VKSREHRARSQSARCPSANRTPEIASHAATRIIPFASSAKPMTGASFAAPSPIALPLARGLLGASVPSFHAATTAAGTPNGPVHDARGPFQTEPAIRLTKQETMP